MKITICGATLQATTLVAILERYGHRIVWYHDSEDMGVLPTMPKDTDCYIFCYSPMEKNKAIACVTQIASLNLKDRLMINGSTFGLHGTAELQRISPNDQWAYFPDTIQEGNAIASFVNVKQAIVGCESEQAKRLIKEILRPMFPLDHQILFMPILDAEFAKLSISGMLATRISYMNDLANVAEKLGVDILNVKQGMAADNRIGASYLSPGVGFGGENFSQDILMLSSEVLKTGAKSRLLEQVWEINEDQKEILFRKLWDYYQTQLKGKTVAIWGAAFKENTASIHNSPIHKMIEALLAQSINIQLFDPQAAKEMSEHYGDVIKIVDDEYQALQGADALCILTAWQQFYNPDYQYMKMLMNHPLILDGRNIYDPVFMRDQGFIYEGIGRV
ncbi:nucleotide sugar dehydrogenase [Wohlfahrtiimonas larvae]|uniref:UDP-glucose 6-dehydrogenase n=1 Tax=Wohlfahrtiimonas larvae TaxID=1157986 RepID=A0ABP9MEE2_9GAMM|nr:nucleotide sugar dehydrogenase [Wohlfahrtiimonas larvae]